MGYDTRSTKPGGDLLFHRLSASTIGAVWFHGRVRDGIGWVTDAMATKLCGPRISRNRAVWAVLILLRRSLQGSASANARPSLCEQAKATDVAARRLRANKS